MKHFYTGIFILLSIASANAQTSVIQDGDGETAYTTGASIITLNAAKSELSFSVTAKDDVIRHWNLTGSFEAKEGTAKLFSENKLQFNGSLGFQYFRNCTKEPDRDDIGDISIEHFNYGVKALYSKISVYDATAAYEDQIFGQSNFGFKANVGYVWIKSILGEWSLGLSLSGGIKDNTDALDQDEIITVYDEQVNGTDTRVHAKTEDVYLAGLINRNGAFGNLNVDFGHHFLKSRYYGNIHFNYKAYDEVKPMLSSAIGLFFMKNGAPLEAIAGIQLQTKDLGDTSGAGLNLLEKTSLVLTVGFPFD
jgi:hypothetical protein